MNRHTLIASIALSAFALPAAAQLHVAQANPPSALKETPAAPALPEILKVVTKADAERFAAAEFAFADSDENESLSRAEFVAFDKLRKAKEPGAAVSEPLPVVIAPSIAAPAAGAAKTGLPTTETAAVKSAEAQFAALAGKATTLAKKAFLDARLAAFAAADADESGALSAAENAKFADIVSGRSAA